MRVKAKVVGRMVIPEDQRIVLDHKQIHNADYSGRKLMQFCTIGCRLEKCRFENADIMDAQFGAGREVSEFVECNFDGMRFSHCGCIARFVRCSFRNVNLREWMCSDVELIDCVFSGRLRTAIFGGTVLPQHRAFLGRERNEFHGNDFSAMALLDADFVKGIDLTQQRLPTGPEYLYVPDAVAAVARLQGGLVAWNPNAEVARRARIAADMFARMVADGQQQLFLRLDSYCRGSDDEDREADNKVFSLLRG